MRACVGVWGNEPSTPALRRSARGDMADDQHRVTPPRCPHEPASSTTKTRVWGERQSGSSGPRFQRRCVNISVGASEPILRSHCSPFERPAAQRTEMMSVAMKPTTTQSTRRVRSAYEFRIPRPSIPPLVYYYRYYWRVFMVS
jgi:hypothetical protein